MKRNLLLLLLLISIQQVKATYTEWYCITNGSNLNAGSTTDATAPYTYAGGTFVAATGVYTVASGNPQSDGVTAGMVASIYTTAGATVATFVAPVKAVSTTTITVQITTATGVAVGAASNPSATANACTCKVGGAWRGPNAAVAFPYAAILPTATNGAGYPFRVNFIAGSGYGWTAAITHALNGPGKFEACTATPGDKGMTIYDGGAPGTAFNMITCSGTEIGFEGFIFQNSGTSGGNGRGLTLTGVRDYARRCIAHHCNITGLYSSGEQTYFDECTTYACNTSNAANNGGFQGDGARVTFNYCVAHDNVGANANGFRMTGDACYMKNCISDSNGANGALFIGANSQVDNCIFYNNGGAGVDASIATVSAMYIRNSIFAKNTTYGINSSGSVLRNGFIINCGFTSGTQTNASGNIAANILNSAVTIDGTIIFPADTLPFLDAPNGIFNLDLNSSAIATGRGIFIDNQAGYGITTSYPDLGASQHQGSNVPKVPIIMRPIISF